MVQGKKKSAEQPLTQPLEGSDLAAYQKNAIVSRTLINKKTGTVTFFAFDTGQGLSEHTAPYDALVKILDGEAEITVSGKIHHMKKNDTLLLPAHKPHALRVLKRFKMLLIMIRS